MWYYDSQIIKTPKSMVISSITYPKEIFRDSSTLSSLGIKPYIETLQNERYYWQGSYSVNTSGATVVGTYAGTVKDLVALRASMIIDMNLHVADLLTQIDWYWQRAAKGNDAVPSAIATYATALYSEKDTKTTEIGNLDTIAKIIEYEARAYTLVSKDEVLDDDGEFDSWHASNTTSTAQNINMVTHFSKHPNSILGSFVSLTAD